MQKIKPDIHSHWFDVPQSEASENSHCLQNWHILLYIQPFPDEVEQIFKSKSMFDVLCYL